MSDTDSIPDAGPTGQSGNLKNVQPSPSVPGVISYPAGVILRAGGSLSGNPTGKGGGRRGAVSGWSAASRRRLRNSLLRLRAPDGWVVGGATFTIPGPTLPPSDAREVWAWYCLQVAHAGFGMIWRVEIQTRGMLHWHCLAIGPDHDALQRLVSLWWDAIDRLGEFSPSKPYFGAKGDWKSGVEWASSRIALPGAREHSAQIDTSRTGQGAWLRYLQDHTSKAKQGQVPVNIGRHWGIVGRKLFEPALPDSCDDLTPRQYAYVRRAYERLATPHRRASCVFGSRLGYRVKRGRRGRAVCFCNPATLSRLVDQAKREYPEGGEYDAVHLDFER